MQLFPNDVITYAQKINQFEFELKCECIVVTFNKHPNKREATDNLMHGCSYTISNGNAQMFRQLFPLVW
jgi:hypothetical protein